MGGYGSGQRAWRNQGTVEGGHPLDVLALRREHGFGTDAFAMRVPFTDRDGAEAEQLVALTWTACRFGGFRPWFQCPDCGRRVVKLYREYRPVGEFGEWRLGRAFCRHCLRLVYRSQREDRYGRRLSRAFRIAERIDPGDTFGAGFGLAPPKPKGMHWGTYDRLVAELQRAAGH